MYTAGVEKGNRKPKRPPELAGFSEQALSRLWRERAVRAGLLRAQHGGKLRIIYPGRPGTSAGPDFRDALIYIEGEGLTRGDVELHLKQGDWRAHGHHRDHRYNSVALHVVYSTEDAPTPLANGANVPVLSAKPLLEALPTGQPPPYLWRLLARCGYPQPSTQEELAALLDRAGDARFGEKVETFRRQLAEEEPEQVLYTAIMEGLGYSQNRSPFCELAYRVPIAALKARTLALPAEERPHAIERWLLEAAGLGTPIGGDEALWHGDTLPPLRWNLFRVRPVNHPRQRIKGAARLLDLYLEDGLAESMAHCITQSINGEGASSVQRGLAVQEDGRALIGPDRARELAVNAVLPFGAAWGGLLPDPALAEASTGLYHRFPKTPSNEIHREMVDLLIPTQWRPTVNSARRQQGLLHLQRLLARSDFRPQG